MISIGRRQRGTDLLQVGFVRKLQHKLFGQVWQWAGDFRRTVKNIGIDRLTISVRLRQLMLDAAYCVTNDTYLPLEVAARLHH